MAWWKIDKEVMYGPIGPKAGALVIHEDTDDMPNGVPRTTLEVILQYESPMPDHIGRVLYVVTNETEVYVDAVAADRTRKFAIITLGEVTGPDADAFDLEAAQALHSRDAKAQLATFAEGMSGDLIRKVYGSLMMPSVLLDELRSLYQISREKPVTPITLSAMLTPRL